MILPKQFKLLFLKKEQIAHETYSFFFDLSRTNFDFYAGQYVRITLPLQSTDRRGDSRFLTISSSPLQKKVLTITTKIGTSEFKKALFALSPYHLVDFFGPMGGFYFRETLMQDHVFLAGGIGITPFWSMIQYIVGKQIPIPITLFSSFSTISDILFADELSRITETYNSVKIITTLTSSNMETWTGEKGRISEKLIKKYVSDFIKPLYFIVGSFTMVTDTEEMLIASGIPQEQIRLEQFTGY